MSLREIVADQGIVNGLGNVALRRLIGQNYAQRRLVALVRRRGEQRHKIYAVYLLSGEGLWSLELCRNCFQPGEVIGWYGCAAEVDAKAAELAMAEGLDPWDWFGIESDQFPQLFALVLARELELS